MLARVDAKAGLVEQQLHVFTHRVYHLVSGSAAKLAMLDYALCSSCESP